MRTLGEWTVKNPVSPFRQTLAPIGLVPLKKMITTNDPNPVGSKNDITIITSKLSYLDLNDSGNDNNKNKDEKEAFREIWGVVQLSTV